MCGSPNNNLSKYLCQRTSKAHSFRKNYNEENFCDEVNKMYISQSQQQASLDFMLEAKVRFPDGKINLLVKLCREIKKGNVDSLYEIRTTC